jgi:hypothetical protein
MIESEFDVEVFVSKSNSLARVRGLEANVKNAVVALKSILNGDIDRGSVLVNVDAPAFPALIGKGKHPHFSFLAMRSANSIAGGSNVKKLETDFGVKIDLLKTKNLVRIRGAANEAENLLAAKSAVISFVDSVRILSNIEIPNDVLNDKETMNKIKQDLTAVESMFRVEITFNENNINIRGNHEMMLSSSTLVSQSSIDSNDRRVSYSRQ